MNLKVIGGLILAVVIAAAIGTLLVVQNIDGIVKSLIEDIGSEVTGTTVTVAEVKISLTDGSGTIKGLTIANPPGFSAGNVFEIDQITLDIDPASLMGSVYTLDEILIDGSRILAEKSATSSNIETLMDNLERASSEIEEQLGVSEESSSENESVDVRLIVSKFTFINSSASLKTNQFGEHSLSVPDIRLRNLGAEEGGLTPEELATEAVYALVSQVQQAISDKVQKLAESMAMDALESKLSDEDKEKVSKLKSLFGK